MSDIYVYTLEDAEGQGDLGVETQDYQEAKNEARKRGLRVICNTYEWTDSEMIDDFTPESGGDHEEPCRWPRSPVCSCPWPPRS